MVTPMANQAVPRHRCEDWSPHPTAVPRPHDGGATDPHLYTFLKYDPFIKEISTTSNPSYFLAPDLYLCESKKPKIPAKLLYLDKYTKKDTIKPSQSLVFRRIYLKKKNNSFDHRISIPAYAIKQQ
jgi:hypothetical protein